MTPAVALLKKEKVAFQTHEYSHDPGAESYGLEASDKLGVEPGRVFKTLVAQLTPTELVVGIVPVSLQLDLKALAQAAAAKKAEMADKQLAQRTTGYLLGGISPLGQKKRLRTFLDASALEWGSIFFSGGKRGLEIELAPAELVRLTQATVASLAR